MLKFEEIKRIEELKKFVDVDDKHCGIPLFHGTRQYALQVSDTDYERFSAACKQVLSFANKFYNSGKIDWDRLEAYYQSSGNRYFLSTVVYQYNSKLYQYGDFYLTTSYENAIGFAHCSGGEAGDWARAQIKGFEDWDIELDDATKAASEVVKKEYKKYHDSKMVILIYYGLSFEDLYLENGTPFLGKTGNKADNEKFAHRRIENLYYGKHRKENFRLFNLRAYTAYALPERMFRDGVVLFENESDVDEFIRQHNLYAVEKWTF